MKKKGKKFGALALAMCCAASFAGCTADGKGLDVVKGLPDYSADESTKQVYIGGYVAPPSAGDWSNNVNYITQESYNDIAACDIDYVLTLYEQGNCEENRTALGYAKNAGVKVLVRWDSIVNYGNSSPEAMQKQIGELLEEEACWGIFARDEPNASDFNRLGKACEVFKQISDKYYYVNLLPNYATLDLLGTKTYREYVNAYCAKVDNGMINEDHYPLNDNGTGKYDLNRGYLSNLEIIQTYAQAYNREHWEYLPGEYLGVGSKTPDYYDLRCLMYTEMCYGVQNMQYFCYWSPFKDMTEERAAFIGADGQKSPIYYAGQKINKEIHKFDHVYMNFVKNWKGAMPIVGTKNEKGKNPAFELLQYALTSTPRIKSVTAEQDTIIGTYQDGDGRDGFMITNYSVPGNRLTDKVTVNFNEADAVIYYREGEYNLSEISGGTFEIELGAGEGVFVIPVKY